MLSIRRVLNEQTTPKNLVSPYRWFEAVLSWELSDFVMSWRSGATLLTPPDEKPCLPSSNTWCLPVPGINIYSSHLPFRLPATSYCSFFFSLDDALFSWISVNQQPEDLSSAFRKTPGYQQWKPMKTACTTVLVCIISIVI